MNVCMAHVTFQMEYHECMSVNLRNVLTRHIDLFLCLRLYVCMNICIYVCMAHLT